MRGCCLDFHKRQLSAGQESGCGWPRISNIVLARQQCQVNWSASLAVEVCVHERLLPRFPQKAIISWTGEWLWVAKNL